MLEGLIRLDYAISRRTASNIYIYIQGGIGEGKVYNFIGNV